jgi:hypothetical protein
MSLTPKDLREMRRWLRASEDNLHDVADLADDKEQRRRLREIARNIEDEIRVLDRKIGQAESNGGGQ